MKVNFKLQQIEYLNEYLLKEAPDLFAKLALSQISGNSFDIDDDTAVSIRDWAGERLQRVGFEGNNKILTERGMLDSIVDLLYW